MPEFDRDGVKSLIRWEKSASCINCNVKLRKITGRRCKICHFSPASNERKTNPNYFTTGIKPKDVFKPYGIPTDLWGKPQLFYHLFYPELNGEYPYPETIVDIDGKIVQKEKIKWSIHHINKENWNDHIWNLLLCLRHEHHYFEASERRLNENIAKIYKQIF